MKTEPTKPAVIENDKQVQKIIEVFNRKYSGCNMRKDSYERDVKDHIDVVFKSTVFGENTTADIKICTLTQDYESHEYELYAELGEWEKHNGSLYGSEDVFIYCCTNSNKWYIIKRRELLDLVETKLCNADIKIRASNNVPTNRWLVYFRLNDVKSFSWEIDNLFNE